MFWLVPAEPDGLGEVVCYDLDKGTEGECHLVEDAAPSESEATVVAEHRVYGFAGVATAVALLWAGLPQGIRWKLSSFPTGIVIRLSQQY